MRTNRSPTKPAVQSLTMRSLAAIAIAAVANRFGVLLPDGAAQDAVSTAVDLVTTLGVLGAAIGRARARAPLG
jgi:methylmalonyl-CoA mutase N-terminal domain/subunit